MLGSGIMLDLGGALLATLENAPVNFLGWVAAWHHKIRLKWCLGLLSYPYLQLPCHSSSLLFKGASHCSMSWQFRQGCLHRQPRVTSRFWSEVRETAAQNGNSVPALSHLSVRTADYSIRRLSSCTVASLMPSPLHHSGEGTRRSDTDSGPSINDVR